MKKNSGSALTSVIVVFLLVTMLGTPLLSMVVYNYRLREYDSGIKEAEYKNEIIMDKISTIIKNAVVDAIGTAKQSSTAEMSDINDALVSAYNSAYDAAISSVDKYNEDGFTEKDSETYREEIVTKLELELEKSLDNYEIVTTEEIIGLLALRNDPVGNEEKGTVKDDIDLASAKINEELLEELCNKIFQKKYKEALTTTVTNPEPNGKVNINIFDRIYDEDNYLSSDITNVVFGDVNLPSDELTKKTKAQSLKVESRHEYLGSEGFEYIYPAGYVPDNAFKGNELRLNVNSEYKFADRTPVTTLSATFIIGVPDFNIISSIEQQTIALSNPTLDYGLIVGKTLDLDSDKTLIIDGNLLAGVTEDKDGDGKSLGYGIGILMNSGSSLRLLDVYDNISDGRVATPGDIIMNKNATLETGSSPLFYRNLYVGNPKKTPESEGAINVKFNGDVFAKDDLEINFNSTVNIEQDLDTTEGKNYSYFGFNDTNEEDEGPDSSSAIVINSTILDNIKISLNNLYLGGRAFIDGVSSTTRMDKYNNPLIYKTGESLSVKGNYIAYQVPMIYNYNGSGNDYNIDKVLFSPYFMKGLKQGIEDETNLAIKLVDRLQDISTYLDKVDSTLPEPNKTNAALDMAYEDFDTTMKWEYFLRYNEINGGLKIPENISIKNIKYIEGTVINNKSIVGKDSLNAKDKQQALMIGKKPVYDEFTSYFGYYPEDEELRKDKITDWLKLGTGKEGQVASFYTYISPKGGEAKETLTLSWNSTPQDSDLFIEVKDGMTSIDGVIIVDGNLVIENCLEDIPFCGMIIVTGKLTIKDDIRLIADKEYINSVIVENYLGTTYENGGDVVLGEGDLFNTFEYDGSGTAYIAISIDETDKSNMLNINELIGITDWKKSEYNRL